MRNLFILAITIPATFLLFAGYSNSETVTQKHPLRVCVANNVNSIKLRIKGEYMLKALHAGGILEESETSLKTSKVLPVNSGINIGGKIYMVFGLRISPTVGANIFINDKRFRGIIDIIRTKNMELLVLNHIDLEDYLYGVLYYETPHYWPMETLMAQAIIARTFAIYRKDEMKELDFDLTSDSFSQVYGGHSGERWRTKRAVLLTRGKVLEYNGKILPTYYHSTCGGHTENAGNLWNISSPALKGRKCPYCRFSPLYKWKESFSYKQIEKCLRNYGIRVKIVTYILEGSRNRSGRLATVIIRDKEGIKKIPADKFRLALGPSRIKSTNFTIEITPKGVIFLGKGWGHGAGLCQWGAFGMARKGFDHKEILQYYYPGSEIADLADL